ncbi:MAG: hypothetical protein LBJ19_00430 [Holosporaceae bacterium]|jgi:hypothetical protein|nr:hypothetical protein [Holosporaceae bacterium]
MTFGTFCFYVVKIIVTLAVVYAIIHFTGYGPMCTNTLYDILAMIRRTVSSR